MKKIYIFALLFSLFIFTIVIIASIEKDTSNSFWREIGSWFKRKTRIKKQIDLSNNNGKKISPKLKNMEAAKKQKLHPVKCKKCVYMIVILDDAGLLKKTYGLLKYKRPLNFSILPGQFFTTFWKRKINKRRIHEIMIHIPMAAYDYPKSGIRPGMNADYIRKYLKKLTEKFPEAKGANNHQGSLATSNHFLMKKFFKVYKNTGLYFVDSITSNRTAAYYYAKKNNVKALRRNYFIDNRKSTSYIYRQLKIAVKYAKRKGHVVVIGHTTSRNLIKALHAMEKIFVKYKVRFITVSNFLKLQKKEKN